MAHFAKLTKEGDKVLAVHVVGDKIITDEDGNERENKGQGFLEKTFGWPSHLWKQTSYNTHDGVHLLGGTPLRKNFAGLGMIYDSKKDVFYGSSPYPSWIFNEAKANWDPPTPLPAEVEGSCWKWDEGTLAWKLEALST